MKAIGLAVRLLVIVCFLLIAQEPRLLVAPHGIVAGDVALQRGQIGQAIADFREALAAQPGDTTVLRRLVDSSLAIQRVDIARVYLRQLVALDGWTPDLNRTMADILRAEGGTQQAVVYWRASLDGTKNDIPTLRKLIDNATAEQEWQTAEDLLNRALALDPSDEQASYQRGLLTLPTNTNNALDDLDRAAIDPQYRNSASVLRSTVIAHNNDSPAELSFQLALTLMSLKAWPDAEHALIVSMQQGNNSPSALAFLGVVQDAQGRDGWPLIERGFSADPGDGMVNYAVALHWRLKDEPTRALSALARAEALNPRNPAIAAELGLAYQMAGRLDSAALWLNAAVALAPTNTGFRTMLATFYADTRYNLSGEGLAAIQKIADQLPDDADIRASLGWALFSAEQFDVARQELERALVLDPTNARARYYFAISLEHSGDFQGAISSYLYVYRDAADTGFKDLAAGALKRLGYNVDPDKTAP